jgi:hypothetical protein
MSEQEQELYDTLGLDEDEVASEDDFRVQRDSDGELLPVATEVVGMDKKIVHKPMTRGDVDEYMPPDLAPQSMSPEQKATILNEFLLKPDFGELTGDDIEEDFLGFADADVLVKTILDGSGYEVLEAQGAKMMEKFEGNLNFEDLAGQMENGAASTPE